MKSNQVDRLRAAVSTLCILLATCVVLPANAATEADVVKRIDALREIKPSKDDAQVREFNKRMDEAWKFFDANKPASIPVLRRLLAEETELATPNQLILLDLGHYLARQGDAQNIKAAVDAFALIDPATEIVQYNFQDLFLFAHRVAGEKDARLLRQFDRMFLKTEKSVFVPQHAMKLEATLISVFLYGKVGDEAIPHLEEELADDSLRLRVMEILIWLGSTQSLPKIEAAMKAHDDHATFVRGTTFMMSSAGKQGRAAMLAIDPAKLNAESRKYLKEIRPSIEKFSYEALLTGMPDIPGRKPFSDAELKKRLAKMYDNFGKDEQLHPVDIVKSTLPTDYLISELARSRSRMFYRLSNEALSDVRTTNGVINLLLYR